MANSPIDQTKTTGKAPTFPRVEMKTDHDDILACCAALAGKTLEEVKAMAVSKCKIPPHGPFWFDEKSIAKLFAAFGFVVQPYREANVPLNEIVPDTFLALIDYDENTEVGRHVIVQRVKSGPTIKDTTVYVVDPAYWIDPAQHVQVNPKSLMATHYLPIYDSRVTAGGKK